MNIIMKFLEEESDERYSLNICKAVYNSQFLEHPDFIPLEKPTDNDATHYYQDGNITLFFIVHEDYNEALLVSCEEQAIAA